MRYDKMRYLMAAQFNKFKVLAMARLIKKGAIPPLLCAVSLLVSQPGFCGVLKDARLTSVYVQKLETEPTATEVFLQKDSDDRASAIGKVLVNSSGACSPVFQLLLNAFTSRMPVDLVTDENGNVTRVELERF